MSRTVLSREEYLVRWSVLHGGYDPRGSKLVGPWLTVVHAVASPFARLGIGPDVVTVLGGLVSALAVWVASLGDRWVILAAVIVGLSGLTDSLDGAVAVMTGRESRWGAVLDSVVDRVSDVLFLLALWVVGAPLTACVIAGVLVLTQEYARARATAVGMDDIGVVTIGERPTRVIVAAMFLLAAGIYPSSAQLWASLGAWVSVGIAVVAMVQLLVVVRRRLA